MNLLYVLGMDAISHATIAQALLILNAQNVPQLRIGTLIVTIVVSALRATSNKTHPKRCAVNATIHASLALTRQ